MSCSLPNLVKIEFRPETICYERHNVGGNVGLEGLEPEPDDASARLKNYGLGDQLLIPLHVWQRRVVLTEVRHKPFEVLL